MTSGFITAFAMLAFVAVFIWVFFLNKKEDFDEQANLPLDEDDRKDIEENQSS